MERKEFKRPGEKNPQGRSIGSGVGVEELDEGG